MQGILDELIEAVSICQCVEDAAKESHIKTTLGVVNWTLLNVIAELRYLQGEDREYTAQAHQEAAGSPTRAQEM